MSAITVAQGKANGLVTVDNAAWDNWPMIIFITEAGGIVSDWEGNPVTPSQCGNIVAAGNKKDHAHILEVMNK